MTGPFFSESREAIKGKEGINVSPGAGDEILEGDILVLVGYNEKLQKIEEQL